MASCCRFIVLLMGLSGFATVLPTAWASQPNTSKACYWHDREMQLQADIDVALAMQMMWVISGLADPDPSIPMAATVDNHRMLLDRAAAAGNPSALLTLCVMGGDPSLRPAVWQRGLAWCGVAAELVPVTHIKAHEAIAQVQAFARSRLREDDQRLLRNAQYALMSRACIRN